MQPPRGTRDFGPREMAQRRRLEERLRRVFESYNYQEVQTPTFEELELFLAKSGPGIREEIYDFKDKGGRENALRPELTAPVMRLYFSSLKMEPKPLRLFYFGPCYRYDRPQAGRYREFWQMGCELIGDDSAEAHAELLRLALALFEAAGLPNYQMRVGHLEILRGLLEDCGVARPEQAPLMRLIDKKDLQGLRAALASKTSPDNLDRLLRFFELHHLEDVRPLARSAGAQAALRHLERIFAALGDFGADLARIRIDPTIARGLEYYTGLVFELDAPDLGAEKQLLGGGAYDLSGVFSQPPVASVGFALGFDRTLVALERTGSPIEVPTGLDCHLAALSEAALPVLRKAAVALRAQGLRVELESTATGMKRILSRASQLHARYAVFAGDKEAARGVFAVKDLASGAQSEARLEQLADAIRR